MIARAGLLCGVLLTLLWPTTSPAEALRCDWTDVDVVGGTGTPITSGTVQRPYMAAHFGEGTLYKLSACDTEVGLIFIGQGEVDVQDPGPQRGPQLHQGSDDLPGRVPFDAAAIWASDGAVESLVAQAGGWADGPVPPRVRAMLATRADGFRPEGGRRWWPPSEVLWAPTPPQGGILAEFKTVGLRWNQPGSLEVTSPWISYLWAQSGPLGDPLEPGLWFRRGTGSTITSYFSGFPSEEDIAAAGTPFGQGRWRSPWDLTDATISLAVSGPVGLTRVLESIDGDAELRLRAGEDAPRWLGLVLAQGMTRRHDEQFAPFEVLGVTASLDEEPEAVEWARVAGRVWVRLPRQPVPGDVARVWIHWRGRVLEVQGETGITALAGTWYPRRPGVDRHRITTTVAVPSFWEVIATGHRIGEEDDGKVKIVTSRANHPVEGGVVVVADVRTEVLRPVGSGLPLIRLHRSPQYPAVNSRVGAELVRHLEALVAILGPYPWSELEVVERGAGVGGSVNYPGVLAVGNWDSPPAQIVTTRIGGDTALGGLVRQWLEHDLGPKSNHDRWLIEGLVTWARCLALEAADDGGRCHGDVRAAQQGWLDWLDRTGVKAVGAGDAGMQDLLSGPVWLGGLGGAGYANVSWRGPLILHALRMLVGDEVVRQVLPRLMVAYGGQGLTLSSFLVQLQGIAGIDLRAFIYGWVFNTPMLPEARLEYRIVEDGEGWTLSGSGAIDDGRGAEPSVPLPTPILLSFKVGRETHVRRLVLSERVTEIRIEGIPDKPKDVRLDPGNSFLGRVSVKRVKE